MRVISGLLEGREGRELAAVERDSRLLLLPLFNVQVGMGEDTK